ncbi:hypothetical protein ANO11243_074780 [Dothideomycetidae sp. 11243]|nr:hypothetical protein ANO11243_074780 [fungal sp. No.11243]
MPARKRKAAAVAEPEPASRTRRGRPSSGANDAAPVKEAPEPAPAEAKKRGRPASKTNTNTASKDAPAADAPKRRGRPPGKAGPRAATTATKRGRPARAATMANGTGDAVTISQRGRPQRPAVIAPPHENAPSKTPERRGRPRGSTNKASSDAASAPKKRGRPPANAPPKRRGRPPKADTEAAPKAAPAKKTTSGKKRGRPAKDVSTDAPAPKRARGRPPKTAPAETSPSLDGANDEPDSEGGLVNDVINFAKENLLEPAAAALEKVTNGGGDRQYWLMKAEPESRIETTASGKEVDVQFSIDDLADKDGPEPWDGEQD